MARNLYLGFFVLATLSILGISSLPTSNESTAPLEKASDDIEKNLVRLDERSLYYDESNAENNESTRHILEKIRNINENLKKPSKEQVNYNYPEPFTGGSYVLDSETLEKIQQIIASGKLHTYESTSSQNNDPIVSQDNNELLRYGTPRALPFGQLSNMGLQRSTAVPFPYMTNYPVIIMPAANPQLVNAANTIYPVSNDINALDSNMYLTRQRPPTLPFNLQWPLAPFFPILIKDPLLGVLHGGGWNNFVEYGQSADVCGRKEKTQENSETLYKDTTRVSNDNLELNSISTREARLIKKRTATLPAQDLDTTKQEKKIFTLKPTTTKKPVKQIVEESEQDLKSSDEAEGDLRFPFGDFTWFGNRKPVAPSPGFFINRLKVRRGGVAIAGPGGVATAGKGGAAIVGPGGLAYTQPGGVAVAGPAARVVALSSDTDLSSVVSRLQHQSTIDGSVPRLLESIPEGKVVATGPVVYYHPNEKTFPDWRGFRWDFGRESTRYNKPDEYYYNGVSFVREPVRFEDTNFLLFLKPTAHAINSPGGVAIANPISNVIVNKNKSGSIVHAPVSSAVVGPGGIAHAQSDLYLYEFSEK